MTDVEIRVRGAYERLSPTERLAADYFLEHVGSFYGTSIAQLSRSEEHTSELQSP